MPAPVANGRSAALARQRDHVESDQRNPYIWPRDSTGLGRREPIVLVSSRCVEYPPNICRDSTGRSTNVSRETIPRIFTFQTRDEGSNTPLILRQVSPLYPRSRMLKTIRALSKISNQISDMNVNRIFIGVMIVISYVQRIVVKIKMDQIVR